ncbi:ATPase [Faecalicoccus pleomorphus]|uniref:ATPase n=1 Tax=Faecalicoccus pleomorphus TaxID=1323 RepID=A0A7X9NG24_9FIRM|nr:BadF/BadG/BcrA/BcrD ATPase family protein [Faecalicoccus pleomorphus]NME43563.1 ATPase [Faecalicoccus pleomorphus]
MNNYFLGVDGGGTKTKFLVCDQEGHILSSSIQSTCHYLQCGFSGITEILNLGVKECCEKANIQPSMITNAFIACAGYGDIPEDSKQIYESVKRACKNMAFQVGNDTDNAIAGSLCGQDGIHVISGTGSIGILKENDTYTRCGGWHHIFGGDEGSAYWISCKLIQEFTKQSDGRHKKDSLYQYVKESLHLSKDSDILRLTVEDWNFDRKKVASLSKLVYDLAKSGNSSAQDIFTQAAQELAEIYITLQSLSKSESTLASYSGGVFNAKEFVLLPLKKILSTHDIRLSDPIFSPDIGSLILSFQNHVILNNSIKQNLEIFKP